VATQRYGEWKRRKKVAEGRLSHRTKVIYKDDHQFAKQWDQEKWKREKVLIRCRNNRE